MAASEPTEDVVTKVVGQATDTFVTNYYAALNDEKRRDKLASFYIKPTSISPLKADITINGVVYDNPLDLQDLLENKIQEAKYEITECDCHVLNTNYNVGAADDKLGPDKDGNKISMIIMICGNVTYAPKEGTGPGQPKAFTDNFVLVPNWEALSPKAPTGTKKFLIQSQTFRFVAETPTKPPVKES